MTELKRYATEGIGERCWEDPTGEYVLYQEHVDHLNGVVRIAMEEVAQLKADYERLREALENVLNSARPSNKEHPTMYAAWQKARELLTPPPAAGIPEEADAGVAARKSEESSSGGRK